jgi:hypothetical protein
MLYMLHLLLINGHIYIYIYNVYVDMTKVCPSCSSSEDYYTLGEIMLRRTKGINI